MIIEVKGVKLDIDERTATTIENLRVGDKVKVLVKEYSNYEVYPGIIVGFSNFPTLPSVEVFYIKKGYGTPELCMLTYNEKSEHDIVKTCDELPVQQADIEAWFDREVKKKEFEISDLKAKKLYFQRWFGEAAKVAGEYA